MKKVITYGTYDLLHEGHVNLLRRAKELGDYLIVGVTSDSFDKGRGKLNVRNNVLERVEAVRQTGFADEIIIEDRDGEEWVYLYTFYRAEEQISQRILKLDKSKNMKKVSNIEKELKIVEEKTDILLSEKQKEAIKAINDNNVTIITGGPGTGKTTIIKSIIEIYKQI